MATSLSVMILAGGQSSRMGQDKVLIPVNGVPLLQRTCQIGLLLTESVLVVTPRVAEYQSIAPTQCDWIQEEAWGDEPLPHGPLLGFAQGLVHLKTPWVLLLACDLPYLQADILRQWQRQLPADNTAIALLPRTPQGWEPLCGFYHRSCQPMLTPYIQQGGRSFQRWLAQIPVQELRFSAKPDVMQQEAKMLFNCNSRDDLNVVRQNGD